MKVTLRTKAILRRMALKFVIWQAEWLFITT